MGCAASKAFLHSGTIVSGFALSAPDLSCFGRSFVSFPQTCRQHPRFRAAPHAGGDQQRSVFGWTDGRLFDGGGGKGRRGRGVGWVDCRIAIVASADGTDGGNCSSSIADGYR